MSPAWITGKLRNTSKEDLFQSIIADITVFNRLCLAVQDTP
jgi:hypothetical protein